MRIFTPEANARPRALAQELQAIGDEADQYRLHGRALREYAPACRTAGKRARWPALSCVSTSARATADQACLCARSNRARKSVWR
jgi:hypothetical protein